MATLTKADAARQLGISRTTLYKLIDQGQLSATPDGQIDTAELVRVMSMLNVQPRRPLTPLYAEPMDAEKPSDEHTERQMNTLGVHSEHKDSLQRLASTARALDIIAEQMQLLREELTQAREERTRLLQMLHEMQHRYDRLLDAPRPSTPAAGSRATHASAAGSSDARGDMRRRIVALLQAHPEGLSPAQTRQRLGVAKSLAHTMGRMARDGLLRRVETGRYVARKG